jgi:hypothetical protein
MKRIGVLAAVAFAVVFVSGAGSSTVKFDLSTHAGVTQYLAAHGIDSAGIVIQRGDRNYAGPSCPGTGWTCSNATRVVQISSGNSDNRFQCTPSSGGSVAGPDSCVIVQISTRGRNDARCHESSSAPVVTQSCTITQQNTSGVNSADISQTVDVGPGNNHDDDNNDDRAHDNNNGHDNARQLATFRDVSTQTAMQTASVTQTNGSGANTSGLNQDVSQRSNTTDAAGTQSQDSHQSATVLQTADKGGNDSAVDQSLAQRATASSGANLTQAQNGQPGGPNTDALITQTSTLGRNASRLNQSHDLRMHSRQSKPNSTSTQTQGTPTGGLNGHVDQSSAGLSVSLNVQDERQRMDAVGAKTLSQTQFGPYACCSLQQSNANDVFRIAQRSSQRADRGATQTNLGVGNCDTSGTCTVTQRTTQNGQTTTNTCTGQSCHTGIVCGATGCTPCTPNSDNVCSPPRTTFTLAVALTNGNGENDFVTSDQSGIDCGPPTHTSCTAEFPAGTVVTLAAVRSCAFGSWTGSDFNDGSTTTVTMTSDKVVTANYLIDNNCAPPPATLTVVVNGGNGDTDIVTSVPAGIDCGTSINTSCTSAFPVGTVVQLTAGGNCDFGPNSTWVGADTVEGNPASVTMTGDKTVTANYVSNC